MYAFYSTVAAGAAAATTTTTTASNFTTATTGAAPATTAIPCTVESAEIGLIRYLARTLVGTRMIRWMAILYYEITVKFRFYYHKLFEWF